MDDADLPPLDRSRYPVLIEAGPEDEDVPMFVKTVESLMSFLQVDEVTARFILGVENGDIDLNAPGTDY